MMDLTDEEVNAIHTVLYDEYWYGEEYCYQDSDEAWAVGTALEKVTEECKRRGFPWAQR